MTISVPVVQAHGAAIPALGFGTWQLGGESCVSAVETALELGYRHIDTASMYGNETEVGKGLRASGVARAEVFVTTKVWTDALRDGALQRSAEASLKRLGLDRVDLLLVHWPSASVPLRETIGALCDARRRGLTSHIGVSNFSADLMRQAARLASEPIVTNQCKYHPGLDEGELLEACRAEGIALTAYTPLGRGDVVRQPTIRRIADAHGRTPAQIALRWLVQQRNVVAIPKAASRPHIAENLAIFDFTLDEAEMAAIAGLGRR
jgi:diketogulonate reductase-like aldo/keto reductase